MAPDPKRATAPNPTVDYRVYYKKEDTLVPKIAEGRSDGRKLSEHRPIVMKIGVVTQAKGSAYVEYNNTKVVCSVFDPREIPNRNEYSVNGELYCEFKFAPFGTMKRRAYVRDAEEKEYSINLRRALEPAVMRHTFPNFQVDIYVLVLENDGSPLAAAITCANLAIANASVPMYDLVTGVTMGILGNEELIDPSYSEEERCMLKPYSAQGQGLITIAYMKTFQQITEIVQVGLLDYTSIEKCINTLVEENSKIYELSRQCLVKNILKHVKEKSTEETDAG